MQSSFRATSRVTWLSNLFKQPIPQSCAWEFSFNTFAPSCGSTRAPIFLLTWTQEWMRWHQGLSLAAWYVDRFACWSRVSAVGGMASISLPLQCTCKEVSPHLIPLRCKFWYDHTWWWRIAQWHMSLAQLPWACNGARSVVSYQFHC